MLSCRWQRNSTSMQLFAILCSWFIGTITRCQQQQQQQQQSHCEIATLEPEILRDPCHAEMRKAAPSAFSVEFELNRRDCYGTSFVARCERDRAPLHVDRVYNLARLGYYSDNYFFRVLPNFVAQFGTAGDPTISNIYNYTSTSNPGCAILEPQPPFMPYCLADDEEEDDQLMTTSLPPTHEGRPFAKIARTVKAYYNSRLPWTTRMTDANVHDEKKARPNVKSNNQNCSNVKALSNTFGTISMSTSYNKNVSYHYFPAGVTWNATAELFLNLADNHRLDKHLFVPICTVEHMDTVLKFPSFGEVAELGGPGPSLGLLYERGNSYIEENEEWKSSMAKVERVKICHAPQ